MTTPTIFETCRPREDVLSGAVADADFAADLAAVIANRGGVQYSDPVRFFADTYPTRGLKNLLVNVCRRLSGAGGEVAAIFRLDTAYGGGKTHGLIALAHAAKSLAGVPNISEFLDENLLPSGPVRIAAFDGENADPANGRAMGDGVLAYTPWGEIAYALAGKDGYERIRKSDENRIAPGAETLRELFGGEPTLILLDELSVYLRKVGKLDDSHAQLTAFLTSLFKAVEGAPQASLVYTLAIGRDGRANDAYSEENQFIADHMAEAESVSARKATLLNPTEDDETVQVLKRRLFERIDEAAGHAAVDAYRERWAANSKSLSAEATRPETVDAFRASYPLHPEVLETLTGKTATLGNFQRVRGMLRLLARTIANLWDEKPGDATAIHVHHIDPGYEPIRQEIVTRLGQSAYVPAISNDIAGVDGKALAEEIDAELHQGLPPYATYAARTIFVHTLAFNEPLRGIAPEQLRYSIISPETDVSFIEEARKSFVADSAYLDDRPGAETRMRFLAEANLRQIIRREERHVDTGEARAQLDDRIKKIFDGTFFDLVPFASGPFDVRDEVGDGKPKLALMHYDALTVGTTVDDVPKLIQEIYERKGAEGKTYRSLRNHLVFVVADESHKNEMQRRVRERLALQELRKPDRLLVLAEHQQDKVRELEAKSEHDLAIAVQQCYRHLFYPSRNRIGASTVNLAHSALDMHSASQKPGAGQSEIVRALRDQGKLRLSEDEPDSPAYVRDRTALRRGQMTTLALRDEFRKEAALPILIGDDIFRRGVLRGVEQGEYVYRRGDLLFGPGEPAVSIDIDEQSLVFTMVFAKNTGIWPRPKPDTPPATQPPEPPRDVPEPPDGPSGAGPEPLTPEAAKGTFTAEGILKEALVKLWEQARSKDVGALSRIEIRMFDAKDGFRLMSAVGGVSGAEKTVTMEGEYETRDGGSLEMTFEGPIPDAQPVREFLEPQLRDAESTDLRIRFGLAFSSGLPLSGDAPEKLTERLGRFASGAAYVSATAEARTE